MEVVGFDTPFESGAVRKPLEDGSWDPDQAMVLADLNPELHRLTLAI